ncbi:MAG: TetR/AcrR family transcriptional regulator [Kiritimatiellae bacterium]|nr:TetR/AcrR family transcriptional regulator [Kiritimatiellia bacterium]
MAQKVDHEVRRREISQCAMHLFSEFGYENVSLIRIADEAGIARTIIYRYFRSKREVMDAAILFVTSEVERRCSEIMLSRESALDRLERVCAAVAEEMFEHQEFVIAIFDFVSGLVRSGTDMTSGVGDFTAGTRNAIKRLLKHASRCGEISSELDVNAIADAIYAGFEACTVRLVLRSETSADAAKLRFSQIIRALRRS